MRKTRVLKRSGPVTIWYYNDKSGYRATCRCSWRDGSPVTGDYIWNVESRVFDHIKGKHERRKRQKERRQCQKR